MSNWPKYRTGELYLLVGRLRVELALSQTQLAHLVDLNRDQVGRYERGQTKVPLGFLAGLVQLYVLEKAKDEPAASACQSHFLQEVNRAIADYTGNPHYLGLSPFENWADLCSVGLGGQEDESSLPPVYTFVHRTFQEYLALGQRKGFTHAVLQKLRQAPDQWFYRQYRQERRAWFETLDRQLDLREYTHTDVKR